MKFYLILGATLISLSAFSQDITITGEIKDEEGVPLESATVFLERVSDSSMISYTVSDPEGQFHLKGNTGEEKANFFISFSGFETFSKTVDLKEEVLDVGAIIMKMKENTLDEVLITAVTPPVTVKKDTLEFNAGSFNTKQNANLEDVMEKLPGVEINREGNIIINGKPVSRIIVNGEEFFGDDPQIALKNLPKEVINKIQVMDTRTESEEFTGESGESDELTVNITIKEDKNKGYFARATAGGGTNERYEMSGIFNYFEDKFRTSVLGSSNNINSSGFSHDETFGMMGRSAARNGGDRGITKSESAGVNAANEWNDKWGFEEMEASGDYFFGRNDTERKNVSQTEYLLPDSRYFKNTEQASNHLNDSHRINAEFEIEFDTLTRMSFEPRINANTGKLYGETFTESLNEDGTLINDTETSENKSMEGLDFSNEIDFLHRFGDNGSFLGMEVSQNHRKQKNENFYYSTSILLEDGDQVTEIQDQYIDEDEEEEEYSVRLRQRSILLENFFLDASYNFNYSHSTNKRYAYDADDEDNYTELNEELSNDFDLVSRRHSPNVGLKYENETLEVDTDFGILHTQLDNKNLFQETELKNEYTNFSVNSEIEYEMEGEKSIEIDFETESDNPSLKELQPVVDRTDPLDIVVGNPELRPTLRHDIGLRYRDYSFDNKSGISSWMSLNVIENQVVSVSTIDENLVRFTRFANVDGAMDARAGVSYNKQVNKDNTEWRFRVRMDGSYDRNIGYTNALKFKGEQFTLNPRASFTYSIDDVLEINPDYQLEYSSSTNDINVNRNENFINHEAALELTTRWPKNVLFANDLSYRYFENVVPGFSNSSVLWNLSLGYLFWDDDAALNVKVYDLLDQNVETRRIIGDDYIRDSSSLILTRYAMFSFTYKLSNFGGGSMKSRG